MALAPPPDFWSRLTALEQRCLIAVDAAYPPDKDGIPRLHWDVRISPRGSADAQECIRTRHASVIAALLEAMNKAKAKGWTE